MTTMVDAALFYGIGNEEQLHLSIQECVEHFINNWLLYETEHSPTWGYLGLIIPPMPISVDVKTYIHAVPEIHTDILLEEILEDLEDRYGNPDGDTIEYTDVMLHAAEVFATTIIEEFKRVGGVYICEHIDSETVIITNYLP